MLSKSLVKDYMKLRLCLCFKNGIRKNIVALSVPVFNKPLFWRYIKAGLFRASDWIGRLLYIEPNSFLKNRLCHTTWKN